MLNWSEIGKNINNNNSLNYFGGNLIFCQKDIEDNVRNEVKQEFDRQMDDSLKKWQILKQEREAKSKIINYHLSTAKNKDNFEYFGIFSKYHHIPTHLYNTDKFHKDMTGILIKTVFKDILINKSLPRYITGNNFLLSLKGILASLDMRDHN